MLKKDVLKDKFVEVSKEPNKLVEGKMKQMKKEATKRRIDQQTKPNDFVAS